MLSVFRVSGLAATLAFVFSLAAVPPISAQSTQAHVYVQSGGTLGRSMATPPCPTAKLRNFRLALQAGNQIVGGTGSKFFTVGKTLLHSYAVGSNGALGSQLSQIGLFNYAGGSCGNTLTRWVPRPNSTTLERACMCCCKAEAVRRVLPTRPTT